MVDLNFLKRELENVTSKQSNQSILWKPPIGKSVVHFLPYPFDENFPFRKLKFHWNLKPSVYCLENVDEKCPVCVAARNAYSAGQEDDEQRKLAKKLFSKMRYYTPVFVRSENGKEVNEVRVYGFGKQIYEQILGFYDEYDMDLTDPKEAPDFVIKFDEPDKSKGEQFGSTTMVPDIKTIKKPSPVASSTKEIAALISTIPEIDSLYSVRNSEEVLNILEKFMDSTDSDSDEASDKKKIEAMKNEKTEQENDSSGDANLDDEIDSLFEEDE